MVLEVDEKLIINGKRHQQPAAKLIDKNNGVNNAKNVKTCLFPASSRTSTLKHTVTDPENLAKDPAMPDGEADSMKLAKDTTWEYSPTLTPAKILCKQSNTHLQETIESHTKKKNRMIRAMLESVLSKLGSKHYDKNCSVARDSQKSSSWALKLGRSDNDGSEMSEGEKRILLFLNQTPTQQHHRNSTVNYNNGVHEEQTEEDKDEGVAKKQTGENKQCTTGVCYLKERGNIKAKSKQKRNTTVNQPLSDKLFTD
ncbi:hypothetical protein EV421DRAFT_1746595 [Armillaria borealis]|uniref:Uncharacterized protein n=1 Tax=Armillaria borealis TaxID=47425 RepID=A0AA39M5N7_9AGAR|nr:hypothetical protein EV421DRAFT_1746595 [Armillaria borealis]